MATVNDSIARGEISLRQLSHFVAVAEDGSIAAAAARLSFSASAVSSSITELERMLGAELCIRRRAHGVTLTPTGRLVLERGRRLLAEAAELGFAVQGRGEALVGPLVVGCYLTLATTMLPRLIDEFERRHPLVQIDFVEGAQDELADALDRGALDVAVLYDVGELGHLARRVLAEPRAYAILGERHPLAAHPVVTPEQLLDYPFVQFDQAPSTRYALSVFDGLGALPRVRHHTRTYELTRSLVARSDRSFGILVQRPANQHSYDGLPVLEREIVPAPEPVPVVIAW